MLYPMGAEEMGLGQWEKEDPNEQKNMVIEENRLNEVEQESC